RFRCIMGDGKRIYLKISDFKRAVRLNDVKKIRRQFSQAVHFLDRLHGPFCTVNRYLMFSGDHSQPFDMVGMFMGNQNPVAFLAAPVNAAQPFLDALLADPDIYQQTGVIASYVNTVAAASAGYTTQIHNMFSSFARSEDRYGPHLHRYIIGSRSEPHTPHREADFPLPGGSVHLNIPDPGEDAPSGLLFRNKYTISHRRFHHIF